MDTQIKKLIESTKRVLKDCMIENGAIVAANTAMPYYPIDAKDYRFVWIRDGAFACGIAQRLGIDAFTPFFKWAMNAEDWKSTGLFFKKYNVDGTKNRKNFQPDQNGLMLMALYDYCHTCEDRILEWEELIRKTADALCENWSKDRFTVVTEDVWEERRCFPDLHAGYTFSIAACSRGLSDAYELLGKEEWKKVSEQMKEVILSCKDHFTRSIGKLNDKRIDSSLLGLVWPFRIVSANDPRMVKTVELIEKEIVKDFGVYRYIDDEYDGWMYENRQRKLGAGYWPLLTFWMSIYYCEVADKKKAKKYYEKVLKDLKSVLIPEQIFDNDMQISVCPLLWSHAMFYFATEKLGLLDQNIQKQTKIS